MYKFEYDITEQEYLQFNEYHLLNSAAGKRGLILTKCMGLIFSIVLVAAFIIAGAESGLIITETIFLAVFSIIWFVRGKKTAIKNMRKQMKKLKKENGKLYSNKGTLILDECGITDISEDKELKTPYSSITQLCVGNNALYIYFSPMMAYIIPIKLLDNIHEFQLFIESKTNLTFE